MTRVLCAFGVVVAAIALSGAVVHGLEDRRTLVAPPDAVAEDFVRQVITHRSRQALPLLAEEVRSAVGPELLNDYRRRIERELGRVGNVSVELERISADHAEASAILEGARGTRRIELRLVWKDDQWLIVRFTDIPGRVRGQPAI